MIKKTEIKFIHLSIIGLILSCLLQISFSLQLHNNNEKKSPKKHYYDYIIIGAGLSGLQSASILVKHNFTNILILEADQKLGGKVNGIDLSQIDQLKNKPWFKEERDGNLTLQIGAIQIDSKQSVIWQLCKDLNVSTYIDFVEKREKDLFFYNDERFIQQDLLKHPLYGEQIYFTYKKLLEDGKVFGKAFENIKASRKTEKAFQRIKTSKKPEKAQDVELLTAFSKQPASEYFSSLNLSLFTQSYYQDRIQVMNCIQPEKTPMDIILKAVYHDGDYFNFGEKWGFKKDEDAYGINGGANLVKALQKEISEHVNFQDVCKMNHEVYKIDNWDFEQKSIQVFAEIRGKGYTEKVSFYTKKVISALPLAAVKKIEISDLSPGKRYVLDNIQESKMIKSYVITKNKIAQGENKHLNDINFAVEQYHTDMLFRHFEDGNIFAIGFYHTNARLYNFDWLQRQQKIEHLKSYIKMAYNISQNDTHSIQNINDAVFYQLDSRDQFYWRGAFGETEKVGTYAKVLDIGDSYQAHNRNEYGIIFIGGELDQRFVDHMEGALRSARLKTYDEIWELDPYELKGLYGW